MAGVKQGLEGKNPSSTTGSTPNRKPRSKRGGKATKRTGAKARQRKTEKPGGVKEGCTDGAKILREAAHQEVARESARICKGLAGKAAHGGVACAKVLVDLMIGKDLEQKPHRDPNVLTEAQKLALEPDWKGEQEEGRAETGEGGVEPE